MIQIKAIKVEEFRGIRELELDLDCKSFVVLGPNGSGKSGVVDAIDFALTGNVGRLSGAGTGGISVLKHGPHVHQRDNPDAARVSITIRLADSGQEAVLTRCVSTAGQYELEPSTPGLVAAVEWAAKHPELTLSRREVIKYVNAEPGRRAQEVQALLKLERIDEIRRLLRSAMTKTGSKTTAAQREVTAAEDALRRHLDLTTLLASEVLGVVNRHRKVLALNELDSVAVGTDLADGITGGDGQSGFNKASAIRDVEALVRYLSEHEELTRAAGDLTTSLSELEADPTILDSLRHRALIQAGIPLVSGPACPLCDLPWPDAVKLREHLADKLQRSESAERLQQRIDQSATQVVAESRRLRALIQAVQPHTSMFEQAGLSSVLTDWSNDLAEFEGKLSELESMREQALRLNSDPCAKPDTVPSDLEALTASLQELPDQTATQDAKTFLTVAQERWGRVGQARADLGQASAASQTARTVYEVYNTAADKALTDLYKTVEDDFSSYYQRINSDDESSFRAGLAPAAGKLDLQVDFYGLGMFPPMAYHSEGHQDGMGVCLYLALIAQLLKDDFRLAILDDVVTSVDTNHRREFCRLLTEVFDGVQFIITTHDEVWARQMRSSGLVSSKALARFHGWSVDGGPVYSQGTGVWEQIDTDLRNGDVPGAAHKLRRSLEASMADIAANIRAQVVYKPDNNYDLGTLFSGVKGRHGDLLKKAAASANSWNNDDANRQVESLKEERMKAMLAQDGENWAINALVHNNDWATMGQADFAPVVSASKQFLELFRCNNCDSWIYLSGPPGSEEALRCQCGSINLNLVKKQA